MPRLRSSARSVSRPSRAGRCCAGLLLAAQIGLTLPFGLAAMPALAQSPAPVTTPAQSPPVQSAPALEPAAQTSAPEQPTPDQTATNLPASDAAAAPSAGDAPVAALLPHDLSPWGMFLAADWVVQAVMIGLVLASVLTWTIWLAKSLEIGVAQRRLKRVLAGLLASAGMEEARRVALSGPSAAMMNAAQLELRRSADLPAEGIKERIALSLGRIEIAAGRAINRGTGVLATIGAISPFVGLFGTVWGIMNAFIGISKTQTTNLAVVAPGIAEALLATAIGLVAAIPAVVIYNYFARRVAGYRVLAGDAAAEVLRLVSRDLDRRDARYSSGGSAGGRLRAAAE